MSVPCEMLLHPELLSNEQLTDVLQERQLRIPNIEILPRDELLDLFHHYCVPYGQRKYRDTGRGKILNRSRQTSPERPLKLNINGDHQNRKLTRTFNERLKPPPDLLSGHLKRIKIDNKLMTSNDKNVLKRRMVINDCPLLEVDPPKKDRKHITWP